MNLDFIITAKEVILLMLGLVSLSSAIGAAMFYLLRTKFMPRKECVLNQGKCHEQFCSKLEEIKAMLHQVQATREAEQAILYRRNVWMSKAFTALADKLEIELTDMPV